jgi:quinol monooxygenase YgiN
MVERWESPEAVTVHGTAEALTTLGGQLADKLDGPPDVRRLSAVPAGDPDKGAI